MFFSLLGPSVCFSLELLLALLFFSFLTLFLLYSSPDFPFSPGFLLHALLGFPPSQQWCPCWGYWVIWLWVISVLLTSGPGAYVGLATHPPGSGATTGVPEVVLEVSQPGGQDLG